MPKKTIPIKQNKRLFVINQYVDVGLGNSESIVEGYTGKNEVVVRIPVPNNKQDEKFIKQFTCLTPSAKISRLYLIDEKHLARHNNEKGKTSSGIKKKTRTKP